MKIGINALYLIPGRVGGSEIYLRRLISALSRVDGENEYIVFTNRENSGTFEMGPNFREHHCPVRALIRPHRIAWEQLVLPYRVREHRLDVLHSPGFVAPFYCPCPSVVTILDLIYMEFPETFPVLARFWMHFLVKHSARRASALITLSGYSRDEILWALDVPSSKVEVVYMGGGEKRGREISREEAEPVLKKYGISRRYILTVAAAHPHKNLLRLIQAYYQLRKSDPGNQLVVVGVMHGRHFSRLSDQVRRLDLEDSVVFTGWVPEEEKEIIYSRARMVAFPSLLEGFGLPILEAMRLGLPVACSDVPSLKEVAGEAAYFFNPYSIEEISRALSACLDDEELRKKLFEKGLVQSSRFTWEKTARDTLRMYERAAGMKDSDQ